MVQDRDKTPWTGVPAGPILFLRGCDGERVQLTALLVVTADSTPPPLHAGGVRVFPTEALRRDGLRVLHYAFELPAAEYTGYCVGDAWFDVATHLDSDIRIAYVSCNGQERGDRERATDERNVLWGRLTQAHEQQPFALLLHGGDQIYADEMLELHPRLTAWAGGEAAADVTAAECDTVRERLRRFLLQRYVELYSQPESARLMARVPSLCMWDDHDICDGWGSLPGKRLDAPIGRTLFEVAREFFLLFQLGTPPGEHPPFCPDPTGRTLTWTVQLPGLGIVAPDLRSERRPDQVMGTAGRDALRTGLEAVTGNHILVLSSVPALGPRLSWAEAAMRLTPRMEKYEDDLRDQWQSRAHRSEWRAFLRQLLDRHERADTTVTVLSGEIHLATRGTMTVQGKPMHQLVASGIAHPPPPGAYASALGALARLGESPLRSYPIRLHPLPGQRSIYTAQRNFLVLERTAGRWRAWWELEHDGPTPALALEP